MAMQYLEREFKRRGDEDLATIVKGLRDVYKKRHPGEVDLALPWMDQSQKYIDLGYHKELSMSQEEYLASLPRFEPQPEAFAGRFDIPILVETRIAPKRQAELAGLTYYLDGLNVRDWEADPKGYKTSDVPYNVWIQDGKKNLGRSVKDVRKTLEPDERGATEYDGIALYIKNPDILAGHYIDLPGTRVGSDYAPDLYRWYNGPEVYDRHVAIANPRFGSASCGRVEL